MILDSSVEHRKGCVYGDAEQGMTTHQNIVLGYFTPMSNNAVMHRHTRTLEHIYE